MLKKRIIPNARAGAIRYQVEQPRRKSGKTVYARPIQTKRSGSSFFVGFGVIFAALTSGFVGKHYDAIIENMFLHPPDPIVAIVPRSYPGVIEYIEESPFFEFSGVLKNHELSFGVEDNIEKLVNIPDNRVSLAKDFSRLSRYDDYIKKGAERVIWGKDFLYAVYASESKGDLTATSYRIVKNKQTDEIKMVPLARGGAQFTKPTAKERGMIDDVVDLRLHPDCFVYGAEYLSDLGVNQSKILGLARYNAGGHRINKIVNQYCREVGIKPEDLDDLDYTTFPDNLLKRFPGETRDYILRVLSREAIKRQELIPYEREPLFSEENLLVIPERGETVYHLARKHRVSVSDIQKNNPHLKDLNRIKAGKTKIHIPN